MTSSPLCAFYGSAKGCKNGTSCRFSHSNPNSVPFCKFVTSPNGCRNGNNCRFRHKQFKPQNNKNKSSNKKSKFKEEINRLNKIKNNLTKNDYSGRGMLGLAGHILSNYQSDDSNIEEGMCGIPRDMCDELLAQGIKPWDDDAMGALSVLYDF